MLHIHTNICRLWTHQVGGARSWRVIWIWLISAWFIFSPYTLKANPKAIDVSEDTLGYTFGLVGGVHYAWIWDYNINPISTQQDFTAGRTALHGGLFVNYKLTSRWAVGLDILYAALGSNFTDQHHGIEKKVIFELDYLQLPIHVFYYFQDIPLCLYVGPQLGILCQANRVNITLEATRNTKQKELFNNFSVAAVGGIGVDLSGDIQLRVSYSFGLVDVFVASYKTKQLAEPIGIYSNQVIKLSLAYNFWSLWK